MRGRVFLVLLAAVAVSACSSGETGDGAAQVTDPPEATTAELDYGTAPNCVTSYGTEFTTELATCEEAISRGLSATIAVGLLNDRNATGADSSIAVVCDVIQGSSPKDGGPAYVELAELLTVGVCPGDVSLIVLTP